MLRCLAFNRTRSKLDWSNQGNKRYHDMVFTISAFEFWGHWFKSQQILLLHSTQRRQTTYNIKRWYFLHFYADNFLAGIFQQLFDLLEIVIKFFIPMLNFIRNCRKLCKRLKITKYLFINFNKNTLNFQFQGLNHQIFKVFTMPLVSTPQKGHGVRCMPREK